MFFFGKKKKEKKQEQAVPVVNKEELIAKADPCIHKQKKQIWQSNIMKKAWNFASSTEKRAQI